MAAGQKCGLLFPNRDKAVNGWGGRGGSWEEFSSPEASQEETAIAAENPGLPPATLLLQLARNPKTKAISGSSFVVPVIQREFTSLEVFLLAGIGVGISGVGLGIPCLNEANNDLKPEVKKKTEEIVGVLWVSDGIKDDNPHSLSLFSPNFLLFISVWRDYRTSPPDIPSLFKLVDLIKDLRLRQWRQEAKRPG